MWTERNIDVAPPESDQIGVINSTRSLVRLRLRLNRLEENAIEYGTMKIKL